MGYYRTNTNPSLQQVNPIIDNIDPLNINIGNENLLQEIRHNINLSFSQYKVFKEKNIYLSANGGFVNNAITYATTVNKLSGARVTQAINVNGNYNFSMWSSYRFKATEKFSLDFEFSPRIGRRVNIVNGTKNINDNNSYEFSIGSNKWVEGWLNYYINAGTTYNVLKSTLNPNRTKYFSYNINNYFEMKLKKKWYIDIDANATIYQKTIQFANTPNLFILNASVKKSITKNENWQVLLTVNDLFNQQQTVNRNISSNFISESTSQTIQRYAMLRLIYNFNKNGKPSQGW